MTRRNLYLASASALLFSSVALADDATLPGSGFAVARYEALWTKSPFSVATPEAPTVSADYNLVGVFRIDGVSYVNVIDKATGEHFVVTSEKPAHGLTLISVAPSQGTDEGSAVMKKETGEAITLTLEQSAQVAMQMPQETMGRQWGGAGTGGGGGRGWGGNTGTEAAGQNPPPVRLRPRLIHLPPASGGAAPQVTPAPQPAPAATN